MVKVQEKSKHDDRNSQDMQPPLTQARAWTTEVECQSARRQRVVQTQILVDYYRACCVGILQTERRTTAKKVLAYRGKGGQNTDTAFLALRLGVVLDLPNNESHI